MKFNVWVLTWDSVSGVFQNLLEPKVQRKVFQLLEEGAGELARHLNVLASVELLCLLSEMLFTRKGKLESRPTWSKKCNEAMLILNFCWQVVAS